MIKFNLYRNAYRANRIYYGDSHITLSNNNIILKALKVKCDNVPTEYNELANKKYVDDSISTLASKEYVDNAIQQAITTALEGDY